MDLRLLRSPDNRDFLRVDFQPMPVPTEGRGLKAIDLNDRAWLWYRQVEPGARLEPLWVAIELLPHAEIFVSSLEGVPVQ